MFGKEIRTQPLWGSKNMKVSDRANGESKSRQPSWPFSWCTAQRALREVKYALTTNGYVALP